MRAIPCVLAVGMIGGAASAQKLAVHDPIAATFTEVQPPTALLPVPSLPIVTYPTFPVLPQPAPFVVVPGDSSFDNLGGGHWFTDGSVALVRQRSPTLGGGSGPPMVFPIPPALLAALGGPITGIAADPETLPGFGALMWTVSAVGFVIPVGAMSGLPFVNPPPYGVPIPFAVGAPITGLEWDAATGTLWAVDLNGVAYNFTPNGMPVGVPVPPASALPGPAGDIAIDKIGTTNTVGARPLYVVAGSWVVDITDPGALSFPAGSPGEGLAFLDTPAVIPPLPGCEGCPGSTPSGPTAFTTRPTASGSTQLMVGMGGLLPGVGIGVFAFDAVAAPLPFPLPNGPTACPLGLTLTPTLILVIGGPANAAGDVLLPIALVGVPIGARLFHQNFTFCPTQPSGLAFSRFQTITCGGL